jgi:hypothetical protein
LKISYWLLGSDDEEEKVETVSKRKFQPETRERKRNVRVSNAQTRLYILLYTYKVGANAHVITRLKRQIAKKNHIKRGWGAEECIHVQVGTFFFFEEMRGEMKL